MSGVESGLNTVKSVFGNIVTKVRSSSIAGQVQQAVTTVNMDDVVVKEARTMMSSGALEGTHILNHFFTHSLTYSLKLKVGGLVLMIGSTI